MSLHSLFNYKVETRRVAQSPGGLQPAAQAEETTTRTASAFISPQALAAFPFAAGLVAAFWQGAQILWGASAKSPWVCLWLSLGVAVINYLISVTDPRLQATFRDKAIGFIFALVNGAYLFVTAMGIKVSIAQFTHQ